MQPTTFRCPPPSPLSLALIYKTPPLAGNYSSVAVQTQMTDLSDSLLHRKLLEAAQSHINSGTFTWVIPPLTRPSWKAALCSNKSLREVYAMQGIAQLKSALGAELRSRYPNRSWNFYCSIRDALLSDSVCSALMINQGATHADAKAGDASVAEGFATILGVFSEEQGFQNLGRWMKKTYSGLFDALQIAFDSLSDEAKKAKREREGQDNEQDANQGGKRARTATPLTPVNVNIPQITPIRPNRNGEGLKTPASCSNVVCDPRRPPQVRSCDLALQSNRQASHRNSS
ncbi:hypothetical protein BDN72DRAFT_832017 [Pluteus cervinus]|uniref:Uncharacterized protein n=1 Tax=Pluteus cervinus TaxID=181527 RepID=A0ACD3BCU5_9AGAR|nr:hypothetical protein BDN72DRAFT_832017 [Pluteus cervinus]